MFRLMPDRTLHLLAYDIRCPRRLRRALQVARAYASGGQKSAHECFLTPAEAARLMHQMRLVAAAHEDNVLLIRLDPRGRPRTFGIAVPPSDGRYLYVG